MAIKKQNNFSSTFFGTESFGNFSGVVEDTNFSLAADTVRENIFQGLIGTNTVRDQNVLNLNYNYVPEKIAAPIYTTGNQTFGVIGHIDPFSTQFQQAHRGILDLRNEITLSEDSLTRRIGNYIENLYAAPNADTDELNRFFGVYYNGSAFVIPSLREIVLPGNSAQGSDIIENDQTALFGTGKVMRDDIRFTQQLRDVIIRYRKFQQKKINNLQDKLRNTERDIIESQKTLSNLNRKRLESASDYQVVKHLATEDWAKIENQYAERERILNNHQGIYFTRVRETPLNANPPAPLALRFSNPDDLVPGCPLEDNDLPEELEPFMESVLDVALTDWNDLRPHYRLLPTRRKLSHLLSRRKSRLDYRLNTHNNIANNTVLALRMGRLRTQNQALIRDVSRRPFLQAQSLAHYQLSSAQLLSLEDLLNGPPHRLRGYAETLRNKLDQASHCLLTELRQIKPSIRLDWSQAAEDDTLLIDKPTQWPSLDRAEDDDFNGVRTMIELVQWWFRQLSPQAHSTSHSAVRNLIRACLMVAAADNPEEIVHGQLQTVPNRFKLGDALRLSLNKETLPGTLLQLIDSNSHLIGTLMVEDHDDDGAVATLTQLHNSNITPTTRFTVTGKILPGQRR